MEQPNLKVSISPHIHEPLSTTRIMWTVTLCLIPAAAWGVYVFGLSSLGVLVTSILAAVITEAIIGAIMGKFTLNDGSAFLTGLLIGMNMPPVIPAYIPAIASIFAIAVVKWSFGGLGTNWMNPALAGRVFVFFSWTGDMTSWKAPITWPSADAVSGASPLGFIKSKLLNFTGSAQGSMDFLGQQDYPHTQMDQGVTEWLNSVIFHPLKANLPEGYIDLFVGNIPGCIGEVSALFLLLGTIYLFAKKIITWEIPVAYIGVFGALVWIFGGTRFGGGFFSGDILFHLLSGGLILGVFYMATDMVTSPLTRNGMLIFGAGAGFFTFLIRIYGSFPEGVSLAIILMNIFVPLINRYTGPERYGIEKKEAEA